MDVVSVEVANVLQPGPAVLLVGREYGFYSLVRDTLVKAGMTVLATDSLEEECQMFDDIEIAAVILCTRSFYSGLLFYDLSAAAFHWREYDWLIICGSKPDSFTEIERAYFASMRVYSVHDVNFAAVMQKLCTTLTDRCDETTSEY